MVYLLLEFVYFWLLSNMWVFSTCVYFELAEHLTAQSVVWEHALDGTFHHEFWLVLHQIAISAFFETAWITTMVIVFLLNIFLISQDGFLSIDNDNKIPTVNVRGVSGFVLTS